MGGRYRVVKRIGAGGMAEVFRAHDELLARDVAVKVFRTLPVTPDSSTGIERQQVELHALARLNHPNLITLFDGAINNTDGPAFLVMELINGPSLSARIADSTLTEREARELGIQIADALAYVHAEGMVHRDVKPANILLGTDLTADDNTVRARLSDFGIVRLLGSERLTSVDFTLGTASYLAPEQARGSDVGPVADVYSLGLVLIEALSGARSFDGPPLDALAARLVRDPEIPAQLPAPWPSLLTAMTCGDAAARPTAAEVARTLREYSTEPVAIPLAAPAGAAGASGAIGLASADAETVGLAALGAGAVADSPAADELWEPIDEPRRRWRAGLLLGAAGLLAALGIGAMLLLGPTSAKTPTSGDPVTATHTTHANAPGSHASSTVPTTGSSAHSSTAATSSHATPSRSSAPTTKAAPSTSAAPSPSTPASSSTVTDSAPATSSAASTAAIASITPTQSPSPGP